ncbi:protein of unknown function [Cupriavidus taiwanensis]|uniref:Uncharacterized protein n=1 Tax=Cupriavidus taiwanensis TaxID=164546 RepID=A0A375IL22_9BURK|nr:hypothetical protein CBM2588_A250004 [Cupriavidus taiwanensis]SOY87207.1 hypothetical protein CBM2591_A330004 [Cupriavidus taiwanensis]SOZ24561.1 hypothetical protein CBM2608_A330022 [Cupriavidus taiwanensis]SOZ60715.1 hypothetical protein CBM2617_A340004 [Cupriavidus taiwanensis]SOZ80793.1 hypothetical protein CBM2618_A300004 [Cupriavidus taiwanensis]
MPGSFPHNALTHPRRGRGAPVKMAVQTKRGVLKKAFL